MTDRAERAIVKSEICDMNVKVERKRLGSNGPVVVLKPLKLTLHKLQQRREVMMMMT